MFKPFILLITLIANVTFAQLKLDIKTIQGEWFASKTIIDPKVGLIKLARVKPNDLGHGTFLSIKDTDNFTLYYSPMCGNDCIWNYGGKYSFKANKLTFKFETYTQHGFCKSVSKSYKNNQIQFTFLVEAKGKDTLVLKRQKK